MLMVILGVMPMMLGNTAAIGGGRDQATLAVPGTVTYLVLAVTSRPSDATSGVFCKEIWPRRMMRMIKHGRLLQAVRDVLNSGERRGNELENPGIRRWLALLSGRSRGN
jgi:hypothetical protein